MISNYHTASSGPGGGENDYYYTFGGMDEDNPPATANPTSQKKADTSKSTRTALKKVATAGGRTRRFGWGRSRTAHSHTPNPSLVHGHGSRRSSADTVSAESMGGQSLTYSTGSSLHSIGDSTTSSTSGFSRMIQVLEAEDRVAATGGKNPTFRLGSLNPLGSSQQQQQQQHKRVPSAGQSVASSLNYSDSEASYTRFGGGSRGGGGGSSSAMSQRSEESMDYSTDASEKSQLEGSKLIQMLLNEPTHGPPPPTVKNQNHRSVAPGATAASTLTSAKRPTRMAPMKKLLGGSDDGDDTDSAETQDAFDLKVEAARSSPGVVKPTNRRTTPTTATSPTHHHNHHNNAINSHRHLNKVAPMTSTSSSVSTPNSILHQESNKKNAATTPRTNQNISDKKNRWVCSLEAIEESIPANVKTFLRPFLCGVL